MTTAEREKAEARADWDAYVWRELQRRNEPRQTDLPDDPATQRLIDREARRYADDLLTLEEYEARVETILLRKPCWWDG